VAGKTSRFVALLVVSAALQMLDFGWAAAAAPLSKPSAKAQLYIAGANKALLSCSKSRAQSFSLRCAGGPCRCSAFRTLWSTG
jgi:hypothetical protein